LFAYTAFVGYVYVPVGLENALLEKRGSFWTAVPIAPLSS
jgi:hypothetical protein